MLSAASQALAAADCEAVREGFFGQPANTVSSVAYLAAGAWIFGGRRGDERAALLGVAVAAIGIGSVLFHGPMTAGAELVHDLAIAGAVAALAVVDWLRRLRARVAWTVWGLVVAALGGTFAAIPAVAEPATAALVVLAAAGRVAMLRQRRAPALPHHLAALAALAAGAVLWAWGRTGGPWCVPDSILQPHAAWHVLSAAALGVLGWTAARVA